jgi:hypothetical protein
MASIQVSYTLEDLGLGRWKAAYEVQNISLIEPIREFTIWFDYGLYSNLNIETPSPLNTAWNECIYQSYQLPPLTPVNGYYDALSIDSGIAAGQFASGFTITFDWTGDGLPAVQRFEVINPQTFQTVAEGQTTHVPEPACWLLLITGSMYLTKKHRP